MAYDIAFVWSIAIMLRAEYCHVDSLCVRQNTSQNLLDAFDSLLI
jgi:hypothetical protein